MDSSKDSQSRWERPLGLDRTGTDFPGPVLFRTTIFPEDYRRPSPRNTHDVPLPIDGRHRGSPPPSKLSNACCCAAGESRAGPSQPNVRTRRLRIRSAEAGGCSLTANVINRTNLITDGTLACSVSRFRRSDSLARLEAAEPSVVRAHDDVPSSQRAPSLHRRSADNDKPEFIHQPGIDKARRSWGKLKKGKSTHVRYLFSLVKARRKLLP